MGTEKKGKSLDPQLVKQINRLYHDLKVENRVAIAQRLGIAKSTVRVHLLSKEDWLQQKSV